MPTASETHGNGHSLIDQAYDQVETFVAGIGHVLGVDVNKDAASASAEPAGADLARPALPAATPAPVAPARLALPAPAPAAHPFEIVEVLGRGGSVLAWIVTNGHERAECASRATAESVLAILKAAQAPKEPAR